MCTLVSSVGSGYNSSGNILKARQAFNMIRQTIEERVSPVKTGGYKGMNELLCSILSKVLSNETKVA